MADLKDFLTKMTDFQGVHKDDKTNQLLEEMNQNLLTMIKVQKGDTDETAVKEVMLYYY
jgi:hypothetical protein